MTNHSTLLDPTELNHPWRKSDVTSWDQVSAAIEEVWQLPKNWNAKGAAAPVPEGKKHATDAAGTLRALGVAPPGTVNLSPQGVMYFRWAVGEAVYDYFVGGEFSGLARMGE